MTGLLPHALSARTLANCPLCLKPLPNDDHSVSDRLGGVRIVGCPAMPTSEIMVTGVASAGSQEPAPARKFGSVDGAPAERDDRTWTLEGNNHETRIIVRGPMVRRGWSETVVPGSELARVQDQLDQAREALKEIRDHGQAKEFPCFAMFDGDCADVMRERARAALAASGVTEKGDGTDG